MSWIVAHVMTPDPVTVTPEAPFKEIAALLAQHRIGSVPVVDGRRRPIGVVTEDDLAVKAAPRPAGPYPLETRSHRETRRKAGAATAAELMSPPLRLLTPDASISEAARLMLREHAHALLIVDQDERLAGIMTRADVLKVFLRPDAELEAEIRRDAERQQHLYPGDQYQVEVRDGQVVLSGSAQLRSSADRLAAHAAMVPGVISVANRVEHRVDDLLADLHVLPGRRSSPG